MAESCRDILEDELGRTLQLKEATSSTIIQDHNVTIRRRNEISLQCFPLCCKGLLQRRLACDICCLSCTICNANSSPRIWHSCWRYRTGPQLRSVVKGQQRSKTADQTWSTESWTERTVILTSRRLCHALSICSYRLQPYIDSNTHVPSVHSKNSNWYILTQWPWNFKQFDWFAISGYSSTLSISLEVNNVGNSTKPFGGD